MTSIFAKGAKALPLAVLVASVAACGLPRSGPTKAEIYQGSVLKNGDAFIVAVTPRVTRATSVTPALGFSADFIRAGVMGSDIIAPGDKLAVTVFENVKEDPLLGNTGQRVSQLQQLEVDGQGDIFIPYAGRLHAAGLTPDGLRKLITSRLDPQTPDPQVIVQRLSGDGATVTVSGDITAQGNYPIERPTRTLSAMLAKAGGVNIPDTTAIVSVTRHRKTEKIWLTDLYAHPGLDIALRPGDVINVTKDARSFTALGATGQQARVPFTTQTISAIEALATVGGLNSNLADPKGVFVFRNEPAAIADAVLGRNDLVGPQRMVYVLNLTEPTGMFEARDFLIRPGDTFYVTEAPFVQWNKTISALTGSLSSTANLSSAAGTLTSTLTGH